MKRMSKDQAWQDQLEVRAENVRRVFHLPSLAVGVSFQGRDYYYQAGKNGQGEPVTKETVYPIGSVSKSFIATAVVQLVEKGIVHLDDPLIKYLPEFRLNQAEETARLTIRDILSHGSGLPRHDLSLFTAPQGSLAKTVQTLEFLPAAWPRGERFAYQNHLYAVATLLVERVSGMPWGNYIQQELFTPLEMTRSYTKSLAYEGASNYQLPRVGLGPLTIKTTNMKLDGVGGAGALSCSVEDLLKWVKLQLSEGMSAGQQVFSSKGAAQLHGRQREIRAGELFDYQFSEITDMHYGLGWFSEVYKGLTLIHHGGALQGFKSEVGLVKGRDFGFAIATNRNGTLAPTALAYDLCDLFLEREATDWSRRYRNVTQEKRSQQRLAYVKAKVGAVNDRHDHHQGTYEHPAYGRLTLVKCCGSIRVQLLGKLFKLKRVARGYLIDLPLLSMSFPCYFTENKEGQITAFYVQLEKELEAYMCFKRVVNEGEAKR